MLRGHNSVHSRTEYQTQKSALSTAFFTFKVLFAKHFMFTNIFAGLYHTLFNVYKDLDHIKKRENCLENHDKEISPHPIPHMNLACEYNHE